MSQARPDLDRPSGDPRLPRGYPTWPDPLPAPLDAFPHIEADPFRKADEPRDRARWVRR